VKNCILRQRAILTSDSIVELKQKNISQSIYPHKSMNYKHRVCRNPKNAGCASSVFCLFSCANDRVPFIRTMPFFSLMTFSFPCNSCPAGSERVMTRTYFRVEIAFPLLSQRKSNYTKCVSCFFPVRCRSVCMKD